MTVFTLDDLVRIMRQSAGEYLETGPAGEVAENSFDELGYDSLALLELAARIQQEFPVTMPDESIEHMKSPAQTVEYVNQRIAAA